MPAMKHTLRSFLQFCGCTVIAVACAVVMIGETWLLSSAAAAMAFRVILTVLLVGLWGWATYSVHQEIYNE